MQCHLWAKTIVDPFPDLLLLSLPVYSLGAKNHLHLCLKARKRATESILSRSTMVIMLPTVLCVSWWISDLLTEKHPGSGNDSQKWREIMQFSRPSLLEANSWNTSALIFALFFTLRAFSMGTSITARLRRDLDMCSALWWFSLLRVQNKRTDRSIDFGFKSQQCWLLSHQRRNRLSFEVTAQ